jgi:hypothetical protein
VREEEIRAAFADGWEVVSLTRDEFSINPIEGTAVAQAWLAVIRRR